MTVTPRHTAAAVTVTRDRADLAASACLFERGSDSPNLEPRTSGEARDAVSRPPASGGCRRRYLATH